VAPEHDVCRMAGIAATVMTVSVPAVAYTKAGPDESDRAKRRKTLPAGTLVPVTGRLVAASFGKIEAEGP
jgi:hypothetical protein